MESTYPKRQRITQIDALRGFALFGILMVNIFVFHAPYAHYGPFYYGNYSGTELAALQQMIFFFAGKFMFIYAFLFGYGCWMQFEKYDSLRDFRSFWNRRMLLLALFGVLHVLLLSFGDILLPYALLGLTLPFVLEKSNRILVLLFLLIYLIPVYEFVIRAFVEYPSIFDHASIPLETYLEVNTNGSFWEMLQLRMHDYWSFKNEKAIVYIPKEWSLFVVGIMAARMQLATHINWRKGLPFWGLALCIILAMYFFQAQILGLFNHEESLWQRILVGLIIQLGEFAHGMFYILGFFLLWKLSFFQKAFGWLKYPGKLSLTNYLMQSLICVIIFSGFGYYGQLRPSILIVLAVVIFLAQALFSYLWLKYNRFGPMEGLWRKYSYRQK